MAKKINIRQVSGDMMVGDKIEDSIIQKEKEEDININTESVGGSVKVGDEIRGSKIGKAWFLIILALIGIVGATLIKSLQ